MIRAMVWLVLNSDRLRAIRGVSLFCHPYMVGGRVYYKTSLRLTLVKLRFIFVTLVRGV